jgi:Flp pilus assembly protein protease CpaA
MLELLLIAIAIIGSLAAGIYDLKTSNIPDSLCITMIIIGLILHSIYGFLTGDFNNLINSLMFGGLFLIFGLAMYFTGQWGGGDGELLVALGVLLPNLTVINTYFPFAISFFINSFFIGAVYSLTYSMFLLYRNDGISKSFFKSVEQPSFMIVLLTLLSLSVVSFFYLKVFSVIFFLSFIMVIFWKFAKSIDKGFYKRIPVRKLKVDDMLGEDIPKLKLYKRLIKGLTKEQVRKIKKNKRYVIIKEGIRYGLTFPLTLIFTLLFGDVFLMLI